MLVITYKNINYYAVTYVFFDIYKRSIPDAKTCGTISGRKSKVQIGIQMLLQEFEKIYLVD